MGRVPRPSVWVGVGQEAGGPCQLPAREIPRWASVWCLRAWLLLSPRQGLGLTSNKTLSFLFAFSA